MDEVTKARMKKLAKGFVDVYTRTGKGHPQEAGEWACENIPDEYMKEDSEELVTMQAHIKQEFEDKGWEVSQTKSLTS